jgi:hypothetical protein
MLVSGGLTEQDADQMKIPYYSTIEQAVIDAVDQLPASRRERAVCVIPRAGLTLPMESTV